MKIRDRSTLDLFDSRHSNADRAPLTLWLDPDEPIGDNFAGGGGARLGIDWALQRLGLEVNAQGVAVNHWPAALAMYAANHPHCKVLCENITKVRPHIVSGGKRYSFAWFSPTCTYFSQAKGGPLDEEATKVRGLAWMMVAWAASPARPRVMCMENVPPFVNWGPLHRQHSNGCSNEAAVANGTKRKKDGKVKPKCLKGCCYLRPIKAKIGSLFRALVKKLRRYYRYVSWRVLKASDYGAPTSRTRFFLIASDQPATWPEPTHGPGRAKPHRSAAECLDFSIPCPSIFGRSKPLKPKTLARIKAGMWRFVLGAARPFVVPTSYGDKGGADVRVHSVDDPLRTIAGNRSGLGIATPYLVHRSNGERPEVTKDDGTVVKGQAPRAYSVEKPLGTVVAQGVKHGLVAPVLIKNNGGNNDRSGSAGQDIRKPLDTIATKDQKSVAAMFLTKLRGTSEAHVEASAHDVEEPLPAISANGTHHAQVAAYLVRYNGTSDGQPIAKPLSTIDTRDRFALVTLGMEREVSERAIRVAKFLGLDAPVVLEIDGEQWVLVDIGFRMLTPSELFRCQGFPATYKLDVPFNGKPLTKTAQIKCVGNSVPPQLADAVAGAAIATIEYEPQYRRAA